MVSPMYQCEVVGIPAFIEGVLSLRREWFPDNPIPEIWFRGTENKGLPLLPGAYWRRTCDERALVLSFKSMVPSYLDREPTDEWEWYYLMQHYGLPTRLLDWTENPLTALFFALAKEPAGEGPCVWVLDPIDLNRVAQGFTDETIIAPVSLDTNKPSRYWLPEYCGRGIPPRTFEAETGFRDNRNPLAVFPKRYNPRIVAQRGVFSIHGTDEIPIDKLMLESAGEGVARIARFCFDASSREELRRDLYALGISRSALFPEPQSVAEDLRNLYRTDE